MNPVDLQELVDRQLKQLPAPRAPRTLLPRVLEATVLRPPVPWYRRAWVEWPRLWQGVSAVALVAFIAAAWFLVLPQVSVAGAWQSASSAPDRAVGIARRVAEIAAVVRVFWHVLLEPLAVYLFALAIMLSLACAVIWTALERLALGGASQR